MTDDAERRRVDDAERRREDDDGGDDGDDESDDADGPATGPLAVVFGLASVPWTYAFVTGGVPLWPSFVASGSFYAAGGGLDGLKRGYASNLAGICYAAATLAVVAALDVGGSLLAGAVDAEALALAVVVGVFMLLATLHERVPLLSFTPGGFFGYATLFSVHAAGATAFGVAGLAGETLAAAVSMLLGACIGLGTERLAVRAR